MTTDFHGIVPFPNGHHGRGIGALIASGSTLLNDLVSWWDLDETSGPRADSVGSNDLTDNNTVTYESGKIGNAAKYIAANNEYLTGTPIDITGDWSFSIWANVKEASPTGAPVYLRNWKLSGFVSSMQLAQNAFGTTFRLWIYDEDAANVFAQKVTVGIGWHNFVGVYNSTTRVVTLYVDDDGSPATSGVLPKAIRTESDEMRIGHTFDYAEDLLGIWDRQLTSDEVTELYNLGASIKNTFTDNGEGFREDLLAYYKLEETSGARANSASADALKNGLSHYWPLGDLTYVHGGVNLTNNNTATFTAGKNDNAVTLVSGSSQSVSRAGDVAISGDVTYSFWFKPSGTTGFRTTLGTNPISSYVNPTTNTVFVIVYDSVAGSGSVTTAASATAGSWHHAVIWYDSSDKKVHISLNGAAT
jgi:hypothetical protein